MSRAQAQNQPSVEELLVSIRQAIHGDGAGPLLNTQNIAESPVRSSTRKPKNGAVVTGSMGQTRVSLQPAKNSKSGLSRQQNENFSKLRDQLQELGADAPHSSKPKAGGLNSSGSANGFAGILSGDVRLEEALAKLKRAGLGDEPEEVQTEIRSGQYDHEEAEYNIEETDGFDDEEYTYEPEPEEFEEVTEIESGFSQQTRQAYIEPAHEQLPIEAQPVVPVTEQATNQATGQAITPLATTAETATGQDRLTSDAIAAETSAAFNRLADTIVGHATTGERSIDELTRELLRPMLHSWLDENLPRIVERFVKEEIERVARWGGK